jgi:uncharacterized protein (TIGR02271 family)
MDQFSTQELSALQGQTVYDIDGDKIGSIETIWVDDETGSPEWISIGTGIFRTKRVLVPLTGANRYEDGIAVAWDKDHVKDSPNVDETSISPQTEAVLYDHYSLSYRDHTFEPELPQGSGRSTAQGTGDAMTRSEEELDVSTVQQPKERVRLRKYIVTEQVQQTVPVSREEIRLEREPITDENRDEAMSGPELAEDEHEEVLMQEEVVTEKRTVPKERVRLTKEASAEEATVSEEIRKEQIEVEREPERRT